MTLSFCFYLIKMTMLLKNKFLRLFIHNHTIKTHKSYLDLN